MGCQQLFEAVVAHRRSAFHAGLEDRVTRFARPHRAHEDSLLKIVI